MAYFEIGFVTKRELQDALSGASGGLSSWDPITEPTKIQAGVYTSPGSFILENNFNGTIDDVISSAKGTIIYFFPKTERWGISSGEDKNKGVFATLLTLQTALPAATDGDYALVVATGTFFAWFGAQWNNTGSAIAPDALRSTNNLSDVDSVAVSRSNIDVYSKKETKDTVGALLADTTTIDFTYDNTVGTETITAIVKDNSINNAKVASNADIATTKLKQAVITVNNNVFANNDTQDVINNKAQGQINNLQTNINAKEDAINKTTAFSAIPANIKFPTEKLVKDNLDLKENAINKTVAFSGVPADVKFPTEKLVKDNLDLKEDAINKASSFSGTPANIKYPTEKLVKDNLDLKENLTNKTATFSAIPADTKYTTEKLVKDNLDLKVDKVAGKGLSTEDYTSAEKTKLAGIATEATRNSTDATLLARANHTGTQAISTIVDLSTSLSDKFSKIATNEITGLTDKATITDADVLMIDDVADAGKKKKVSALNTYNYVNNKLQTQFNNKVGISNAETIDGVKTFSTNIVITAIPTLDNHAARLKDVTDYSNAKVVDAINDGIVDKAPSQNAVFDALALKTTSTALRQDSTRFVELTYGSDVNNGLTPDKPFASLAAGWNDVNPSGQVKVQGASTYNVGTFIFDASKSSIKTILDNGAKITGTINLVVGNTSMQFFNGKISATINDASGGTCYFNNVDISGSTLNFSNGGYKFIGNSTSSPTVITLTGTGGTLVLQDITGGVVPLNIGAGWVVVYYNCTPAILSNSGTIIDGLNAPINALIADQATLNAILAQTSSVYFGYYIVNFDSPAITGMTIAKGDVFYKASATANVKVYTFGNAPASFSLVVSATQRTTLVKNTDKWVVAGASNRILGDVVFSNQIITDSGVENNLTVRLGNTTTQSTKGGNLVLQASNGTNGSGDIVMQVAPLPIGSITFGTSSSFANASAQNATFAHSVPSGTNRLLLVSVVSGVSSIATTVTYGGVALTEIPASAVSSINVNVQSYFLVNPTIGNANIIITRGALGSIYANAVNITNVDATNPIVGADKTFNNSQTTAASLNVSTVAGQVAVGVIGIVNAIAFVGADQVLIFNGLSSSQERALSSYEIAATTTTTISYSFSSSTFAFHSFAINPIESRILGTMQDVLKINLQGSYSNFVPKTAIYNATQNLTLTEQDPQNLIFSNLVSADSTVKLPNATRMQVGTIYNITNLSFFNVAVSSNNNTAIGTVSGINRKIAFILTSNTNVGGTWVVDPILSRSVVSDAEFETLDGITTGITIQAQLNSKQGSITAGTTSQYFRGDKTFQTLDKAAVGLSNVDNTADATKNVLSASKLTTARVINGILFDGTGDITIADNTKETAFAKNTAFNKNFGSAVSTVAQGNDARLGTKAIDETNISNNRIQVYNSTADKLEYQDKPTSSTNLSIANKTATTLDILSDTGTDATVPQATITEAGLLIATDKVKLNNTSGTNSGDQDLSGYLTKADNLNSVANKQISANNLFNVAVGSGDNGKVPTVVNGNLVLTAAGSGSGNMSATGIIGATGKVLISLNDTGTSNGLVVTAAQKQSSANSISGIVCLTTTERDSLSWVSGDIIYNTTYFRLEKYNGTSWVSTDGTVGHLAYFDSQTAPLHYIECDNSQISRTGVFSEFWTLNTSVNPLLTPSVFTITSGGIITKIAHGLTHSQRVRFTTTGVLPTAIIVGVDYIVTVLTVDTFRISTTPFTAFAGSYVSGTGTPSGVHSYTNTLYGQGNGTTTQNAPDARGVFLRGTDPSRIINSTTFSENGSLQGDAIRNITGSFFLGVESAPSPTGAFTQGSNTGDGVAGGGLYFTTINFNASNIVPTATENRPKSYSSTLYIKIL